MKDAEIGIIGLGVMGSSLAKNVIIHGFPAVLYSISENERNRFRTKNREENYDICDSLEDFIGRLKKPRKVLLMITAGQVVDQVAESLMSLLDQGDIIIDGGNSYYKDTNRRRAFYKQKGIEFVGLGISGGEKGALNGPSMMFGGSFESWVACRNILQAIAAESNGHSCCDYVSEEGSGHYVKMVHNGIEYGNLQLIAETYYFMKNGLHMTSDECAAIFKKWSKGKLSSYLTEITATVLSKKDEDGANLVEKIKDVAGQKGTGTWTLQEGMERKVYIPTIFEAVSMRNYSETRQHGITKDIKPAAFEADKDKLLPELENALYLSQLCSYAQGIELIAKASSDFGWNIDLAKVVSLWENGCIIRSGITCDIVEALKESKGSREKNILTMGSFRNINREMKDYRAIVSFAAMNGVSIPAMSASLSYYEVYQADQMPINLIQGLRDCFGAHTYERTDKEGIFHTVWE